MVISKTITFCFVLIGSVLGEEGLLRACNVNDVTCLSRSAQQFLNHTAKGIPQYDIRAIDPLVIPLIKSSNPSRSFHPVSYTYKNLTVLGLKDHTIADFKMNLENNTVELKTNINVNFEGVIEIDFTKPLKSFSGIYSGRGKAIITSRYPYVIKKDDKGVEHFEVGKEEIICEPLEADANLSEELMQQLSSDTVIRDLLKKSAENREQQVKNGLCKVLKAAYPSVIHNIRAVAKILPKNAFFKDL